MRLQMGICPERWISAVKVPMPRACLDPTGLAAPSRAGSLATLAVLLSVRAARADRTRGGADP